MSDEFTDAWSRREPIDPVAMARRDLKKALPRRFYTEVATIEAGDGFGLVLDGKPLRTPAKAPLVVSDRGLADALAAEWRAQAETIEPATMAMTRLVNSALDGVAQHLAETIAEVAKFAETDLVCYRAGDPDALVEAQAAAWDPILAFAREALGARFVCTQGIVYVAQPEPALQRARAAVEAAASGPSGILRLAALSVATSLTGSVLIALALAGGAIDAEAAWNAAHVDEDHQMRQWGGDDEALARRARRWHDMRAAATVLDVARR